MIADGAAGAAPTGGGRGPAEIPEGQLVRHLGPVGEHWAEDLGVGVAGPSGSGGRVVDFVDTVGPLACVDDDLVPTPHEWTPARALDVLAAGLSAERVAEISGYDPRWVATRERWLAHRWSGL